jgi:stage II sporulation SpoE-like protein
MPEPITEKIHYHRLLILFVLALLGYGAMFYLFPRIDPAARWGVARSRDDAIAKARETALHFGSDVGNWGTRASASYNSSLEYYISQHSSTLASTLADTLADSMAATLAARLFTPVSLEVRFFDYKSRGNVIVQLNSRGEAIGYRTQGPEPPAASGDRQGETALNSDQELAEKAVKQLFGTIPLPALSDVGMSKDGRKFTWAVSDQQLKLTAEVLIRDATVRRITLDTSFTAQFQNLLEQRRGRTIVSLSRGNDLVLWPTVLLIAVFYFVGLALKQIDHRSTLIFLGLLFLIFVFTNSVSNIADANINTSVTSLPRWLERILFLCVFLLINLMFAAALYFCWSASLALATRIPARRTIGLELLLSGKILTRPVTNSIIAGLLFGGILSAIPYLVAAIKIFPGVELNPEGFEDVFISRSPAVSSCNGLSQISLFVLFSFIASLIWAFIKRRMVARTMFFIIALLMMLGADIISVSPGALILVASLNTLLFTTIYYRHGLLAVIVTGLASRAMVCAAALLAQPSTSLQHSGFIIVIGLGVFTLISLAGAWKSREIRADEVALHPGSFTTRSERERLKAELAVARLAQQRMLPDQPPRIEALDIAAVCHPSKEVGGDLYDFIPLPEDKLAIVVADVSGKGVPASLYMTLTKGLLDSVLQDLADPGAALREINRHLYEVCRRKVFVTLFLGIIDPKGKTLVYARAGHNPTLYHRAADQSTLFLKSPGIGLGLNSGKIFDASLQVASLQLEPNDTLLFYSDGITEAMNGKSEEYGEERLMKIVKGFDGMGAEEACRFVMADVNRFLGPIHPQDDQTMVVVRVR